MANIASGVIEIACTDKNILERIIHYINLKIDKNNYLSFGKNEDGILVDHRPEDIKTIDIYGTNWYHDYYLYNCKFYIDLTALEKFMNKVRKDLRLSPFDFSYDVLCEECGNLIFINTDEEHLLIQEKYYVDAYNEKEDMLFDDHYYYSDEKLLEDLRGLFNDPTLTMDFVLNKTLFENYTKNKLGQKTCIDIYPFKTAIGK